MYFLFLKIEKEEVHFFAELCLMQLTAQGISNVNGKVVVSLLMVDTEISNVAIISFYSYCLCRMDSVVYLLMW